MKRIFTLLLAVICTGLSLHAQWHWEKVDNGLDEPYKVAYTDDNADGAYLKMFKSKEGNVGLIIGGNYFCNHPAFDLALKVDTGWVKFSGQAFRSEDHKRVYLYTEMSPIKPAFRKASLCRIRIYDEQCGTDIYDFPMTGSSAALLFMDSD